MSKLFVAHAVVGVLLFLFSIGALVGGSVCLHEDSACSIDRAASGGLVGAGVMGLIGTSRMLFIYSTVGRINVFPA